jgi:pilus assembly protein CpaD
MQIKSTSVGVPVRAGLGFAKFAAIALLSMLTSGCNHDGTVGSQVAGWTLTDPEQRHPILVSQQPATLSLRVPSSADGLTPPQRARVLEFASHSSASDAGNSRIVISAPGGSANEGSAMQAADEIRQLLINTGYSETKIAVEAYQASGRDAPVRLSYMRYVAQAPECGDWSENLARSYQNLPYPDMGCANQRNLAVQVANPADLLGPRTMTPRDSNRRDTMYKKYVNGEPLGAAQEAQTIQSLVNQ